jgi:hypothetical protein
VVVDHGRVVVEWGNPAMKIMVSSVRKSLLSVLYGINQPSSKLDLDTTIAQLGIDFDPPLTAEEKKATVVVSPIIPTITRARIIGRKRRS